MDPSSQFRRARRSHDAGSNSNKGREAVDSKSKKIVLSESYRCLSCSHEWRTEKVVTAGSIPESRVLDREHDELHSNDGCSRYGGDRVLREPEPWIFKTTKERVGETRERWKKQEGLSPSEVEVLLTEEEEIRTWLGLEQWAEQFGHCWSFRGHADERWLLQTAYHRATHPPSDVALDGGGTIRGRRPLDPDEEHEKRIFREFQDQYRDTTAALEIGYRLELVTATLDRYAVTTRRIAMSKRAPSGHARRASTSRPAHDSPESALSMRSDLPI